jgi:transposase-like protein
MARPSGVNLSEGERIHYGDKALALKLSGMSYEEIGAEIGVHRNTVGGLVRDAARRRSRDRDLTEEINRAIATRQQVIEDLSRRMRALPRSGTQAAFAHARLAEQVRKSQLELLFLSGVEVPDPEQIIMDALEAMRVSVPELADLIPSYPEASSGAPEHADVTADYPVIAEDAPATNGEGGDYYSGGWGDDAGDYFFGGWGNDVGEGY